MPVAFSNGRRILHTSWVSESTRATGGPGPGYGYQWWTFPGNFAADEEADAFMLAAAAWQVR